MVYGRYIMIYPVYGLYTLSLRGHHLASDPRNLPVSLVNIIQYIDVHWSYFAMCFLEMGTLDTVPLCVINSLLPDFLGTEWFEQWGESTECQRHSSTLEPNNQMLQSQFHIPANDVEKPLPIGQLYWTFGSHVDRKTWFYMALHIGYVLVLLKSGARSRQYWYPMKHGSFWVSFGIPIFANPTLWD